MYNDIISVYIPTHNRSEFLKRAVNSVLNQTYTNFEIIIVDDGSSDDTELVVKHYLNEFDNIVYLKHTVPKGACAARNAAISVAKGMYITGLDDDDEFMPQHLRRLLTAFDEKYAFIACSLFENTGNGIIKRSLDCGVINLDDLLHYNKIGNQVFTLTSRMRTIGGFDVSFPAFQDYDTWVRLITDFGPAKKIKHATYIWHTGHEQERITHDPNKRLLALDLFINKHQRNMKKVHIQSMFIIKKKLEGTTLTLVELLLNANRFNYKAALSTYINLNFPVIGNKWREYKRR
ncbi:glycosyltransferase [Pseudoalteromonas nigrifaciens]|uniref:glycosyltransferase n=1 Tax=Pseudoalteromonas nigrifaciens TaxID=28109 RepID=UPI003FB9669F